MFETMVDFLMVEHLYGATFDPPVGAMGYSRILTRERRPFKLRDGYLAILPYTDRNWHDFFRVLGREELSAHTDFANLSARVRNAGKVYGLIAELVADCSCAELQRTLEAVQIPVMPVSAIEDLLDHAQLAAGGFWQEHEHPTEGRLRLSTLPIRFGEGLSGIRRPAPLLGEHSTEILGEIGYTPEAIERLFETGVSKTPARDLAHTAT